MAQTGDSPWQFGGFDSAASPVAGAAVVSAAFLALLALPHEASATSAIPASKIVEVLMEVRFSRNLRLKPA